MYAEREVRPEAIWAASAPELRSPNAIDLARADNLACAVPKAR